MKSRDAKPRVKRGVAKPRAGSPGSPKSATRGKRATKPARKAAPRKAVARKAVAHKAVPRKAVARKTAPRKAVARKVVQRRTVASKAPPRRATAPRHAVPPAFATQRAAATAREHLLFELQRARASVKAAIQGMTSASAMRPIARGKWSTFELVLHLSERDRVRLEEFGRTLAGQRHSWAGMHDPAMSPVNEMHLAPLRAHTWDEAVRRLDSLREELLRHLAEVPAQPDDVWLRGHAFGDMLWGLPDHDRHHAEQIKRARIRGTSRGEVGDV